MGNRNPPKNPCIIRPCGRGDKCPNCGKNGLKTHIIEWEDVPPPPVVEVSSHSESESDPESYEGDSDSGPDDPYGPHGQFDDPKVWLRLRRSKRVWENVNKKGGKRARYFPEKRKKGGN